MELLAVFPPLIAFIVAFLMGKKIGDAGAQFITCAGVLIAAVTSIYLFFDVVLGADPRTIQLMTWIDSGSFQVNWALRVDQLAVIMMCVVNIVSACVHVYSVGYMHEDPAKGRFMAYLSLFTFAMLMLVTADNLVQLFFGWEGVGVASYLLIGFWNYKDSANAAAIKAFVVNRVGDFGLALGIFACFVLFGTVQFDAMFDQAATVAGQTINFLGYQVNALTVACLLLFMGAMGKSAQLGLHTWLPDAMEGPTPVSALIHAATMVTAGVFLVARMSPVFEYAPVALMVVTLVGAATAFVAATIGMTQFDIKRVIAYSTMSQLGYMFFALGVSAYSAAIFHLMTHAFFKALLFLGAGSVIHALHHEQDMRNMGGVFKKIPLTYGLMWIGSLALAGIPIFAGYYSKDIVLESAFADHTWFGNVAYWAGIAAALMTAFYSARLLFMTFHGKPRMDHHTFDHAHESPPVMMGPLVVLAIGAVFSGMVFYEGFVGGGDKNSHAALAQHAGTSDATDSVPEDHDIAQEQGIALPGISPAEVEIKKERDVEAPVLAVEERGNRWDRDDFWGRALFVLPENNTVAAAHHVPEWVKFLPMVMGIVGILLGFFLYVRRTDLPGKIVLALKPIHTLLFNKWFFDELYHRVFVLPALWFGRIFWKADKHVIDGLGPDGISRRANEGAGLLSRFQSGFVFQYAFIMMVGLLLLVSYVFYKIVKGQGY